MLRKRSGELPRYVSKSKAPASPFRRRNLLYLVLVLAIFYFLLPPGRSRVDENGVDWSRYAYSLYATDDATLCHAVLIINALATFGSKADRVLFYPKHWDTKVENGRDRISQLLVIARDDYRVKLQPIDLLTVAGRTTASSWSWSYSVTKLMAFSLTDYDRVVSLDSDVTLLQSIDELFLLPPAPIALPRAYWYGDEAWPLSPMLMVVKPDMQEFNRFRQLITGGDSLVEGQTFDMDLINERFKDTAIALPHRPYALLTGEFRKHNHSAYLGNKDEEWDAEKVYKEAKLVHFSDWPLPKPWIMWPLEGLAQIQPDCGGSHEGTCAERNIWKHLYEDFRARRKDICMYLSVPAPDWAKISSGIGQPLTSNVTEATPQETPSETPHSKIEPPPSEQTVSHDT